MLNQSVTRRQLFKTTGAGAGALALASMLGGAPQAAHAAPAATLAAQAPLAQATPERVKQAVAQLEKLAAQELKATGIPGIGIAVVYKDQVLLARGFGVRVVGKPDLVDADTVFQLASVSKPIGSGVVAALVGEGVINWDTRISDIDSSFEMFDPWVTREITVRDLYCHRSGLPDHAGDLAEDMGYTREEVIHRLRYCRPDSSFRTGYAYNNFGMSIAAFAASKAAGAEWEALSQDKLYGPLGMKSTSSRFEDFESRTNKALSHVRDGGKWAQKFVRDANAQTPAAGVSSSPNDLAQWMRFQIGGGKFAGEQIVDAAALAETHHPHMLTGFNPFNELPGFYGLGWGVSYTSEGKLRLAHSGAFALGVGTNVVLMPQEELGVIVLTNAYPIGVAEGLAAAFIDLAVYGKLTQDWVALYKQRLSDPSAVGVILGRDYSKPPATPKPALALDAYTGTYENDFFGEIEIIAKDKGLAIVEGPAKQTSVLTHYDRDTFTYETQGENAVGTTGVFFTVAPDGQAMRVEVENLNIHKEGVFVRKAVK